MPEKDFAVGSVGIPSVGQISKKPCYLVALTELTSKSKSLLYFVAIDKPESQNGFIQAKGIYADLSEEELVKKFAELLSSTPKENILDMMFPWHRVYSIRSLVFNANKPSTLIK